MPHYDFGCGECGLTFEQWKAMADETEVHCPDCGGVAQKKFTPAAVVFKGEGFYKTDSRPKEGKEI